MVNFIHKIIELTSSTTTTKKRLIYDRDLLMLAERDEVNETFFMFAQQWLVKYTSFICHDDVYDIHVFMNMKTHHKLW